MVLAGRGRGAMTTVCSARRRVSPRDKALRSLLEKSQARLPREAGDAGPSTVGSHHLLIVLAATSHTVRERSTQRKARENAGLVDFGGLAQIGRATAGLREEGKKSLAFAAFAPDEPNLVLASTLRGGAKKKKEKELTAEDKVLQFTKEVHKTITNLLAGAIAGASVESALYPIDTIKTRLQAMKGTVGLKDKMGALRGSTSLYSGLLGNLVGVIPASALFFSVYEPVKVSLFSNVPSLSLSCAGLPRSVDSRARPLRSPSPSLSFLSQEKLLQPSVGIPQWCAQFAAAATAAVSASFIRVPTEVVKSRMQVGQFTSAVTAAKTIIGQEGFTGIYAGYKSFLLRDITFDVIEFVSYEQIRNFYLQTKLDREGPEAKLSALEGSAIGAMAGALTATFTTPFDVIKTRLMLQGQNRVYAGVIDCTRKIVLEEGMGGLFKGVGPRVTWISIGGAVFFGALEKAKSLLEAMGPQ